MDFSLNIFTLNCWAIPLISKNRKERIQAIADYLSKSAHDIVCLQEIWSESDYLIIKENIEDNLPHSYYAHGGLLGSGLCVFSKCPIQDVFFYKWPLNGYIQKLFHADWYGGKGILLCRIKQQGKLLNIYCTHLHANYDKKNDIYLSHRLSEAYSAAQFVNLTRSNADVSIVAGDLNTTPEEVPYRILTQLSGLQDPFYLKSEHQSPSVRPMTGTSDNTNNTYSDTKSANKKPEGNRIDHILFSVNPMYEIAVEDFGNPLPDKIPEKDISYSDHNAVMLHMTLRMTKKVVAKSDNHNQIVNEAINIFNTAVRTVTISKRTYLCAALSLLILLTATSIANSLVSSLDLLLLMIPIDLVFNTAIVILTLFCVYSFIMVLWKQMERKILWNYLNSLLILKEKEQEHVYSPV